MMLWHSGSSSGCFKGLQFMHIKSKAVQADPEHEGTIIL
jgi:hypothetical protein